MILFWLLFAANNPWPWATAFLVLLAYGSGKRAGREEAD
jgi:hypothetical protein